MMEQYQLNLLKTDRRKFGRIHYLQKKKKKMGCNPFRSYLKREQNDLPEKTAVTRLAL